jgi:hypothetical protein
MAALSRFQMDLTPEELDSIERWSAFAGFRTKRDFFLNAFTLFQWAAKQILLGRSICAINEETGEIRHLEMPGLAAIASKTRPTVLSSEEIRQRAAEPGRPFEEVLATLKGTHGGKAKAGDVERQDKPRAGSNLAGQLTAPGRDPGGGIEDPSGPVDEPRGICR